MEQIEPEEESVNLPTSYLVSVISIGIALIITYIVAGYNQWPFILTVMLGAIAQTIFRIIKRVIKNNIQKTEANNSNSETSNMSALKIYTLIYIMMLFVTALWYGIGVVIEKLF